VYIVLADTGDLAFSGEGVDEDDDEDEGVDEDDDEDEGVDEDGESFNVDDCILDVIASTSCLSK
jgi:hypothetical protein